MTGNLMEYFNRAPRLGVLASADGSGKVDVAVLGSPRMIDEKTVVIGLGKNRTLANLQKNPHAVYMIMEPGATLPEWKGIRVYLTMKSCAASGPILDEYRKQVAVAAGEQAAAMIQAVASFGVDEVRPIVDFGQGWERSV
jgi:hypothetical protein